MRSRALLIALTISLFSPFTTAIAAEPKVAIAYDIGFLGDNSFNDAVHLALKAAKKKYGLVEPFVREVPTNGTAVDRLTRLRFLAKSGYTLIIAVGPGYRQTVARVSKEYTETQFAIINDKSIAQLNVSNIYFREDHGAYLAGIAAANLSKRKSIAFIGSEPELLESFTKGARVNFPKVKIKNVSYPDSVESLRSQLSGVDIAYSTWDGDPSVVAVISEDFAGKIKLISEIPDQYFAQIPQTKSIVVATVSKQMSKPISQLVSAALESRAIIDVLDDAEGIYGREYNATNGGVGITFNISVNSSLKSQLRQALIQLKQG
ncbi:MAG TPA: BMP family ABC transporter substrate-binding protein [Candidatus Nanopelagicaceae bacterium]|jgi:basic membrane protein A|nr:BMP family ABC transporter substrate-binding protein [Candidatus Nanopelagicaceae bacterium]